MASESVPVMCWNRLLKYQKLKHFDGAFVICPELLCRQPPETKQTPLRVLLIISHDKSVNHINAFGQVGQLRSGNTYTQQLSEEYRSQKRDISHGMLRSFNQEWTLACSFFARAVQIQSHCDLTMVTIEKWSATQSMTFKQTYPLKSELSTQKIKAALCTVDIWKYSFQATHVYEDVPDTIQPRWQIKLELYSLRERITVQLLIQFKFSSNCIRVKMCWHRLFHSFIVQWSWKLRKKWHIFIY